MSDTLANIYPIPVEFVDGQQPTARFFNAWATQIDNSFKLLSNVVGDFDGAGEAEPTFVPNLVRAIGNLGLISSRLPRNLRIEFGGGPDDDLPFIEESLAAYEGMKEALLTFTPEVLEANDAEFTSANLGTAVAKGVGVITSPLQHASISRFILDGRRIITNEPIPSNAYVVYPIDTSSDSFSESMGESTGANVIPSIQDIMRPIVGPPSNSYLCQLSKPAGYGPNEYKITFPKVQDVRNPLIPWSVDQDDVIKLSSQFSPVHWNIESPRSAPYYVVPQHIRDVTAGSIVPTGLCALWYRDGGVISRIRDPLSASEIIWELLVSDNAIKITIPAGLELPSTHEEPGFASYIVGFAGTSISEAVLHLSGKMITHAHDGREGSQVSAFHLKDQFNSEEFAHSGIGYNHFPQYLLRAGYSSDNDFRNGNNVFLGDFLLGIQSSNPEDPIGAAADTEDSHKILFGSLGGPSLFYDFSDTGNAGEGSAKKLRLDNAGLRVDLGKIWLGEVGSDFNAVLVNAPDESDTPTLQIIGENGATDTLITSGQANLLYGRVIFGEAGDPTGSEFYYDEDEDDENFPYTWYLDNTDGNSEKTKLVVGKIGVDEIAASNIMGDTITPLTGAVVSIENLQINTSSDDPFIISLPIGDVHLLTGGWGTPSGEADYCPTPMGNDLEFVFSIPRIEKIMPGIDLGKFWALTGVSITFVLSKEESGSSDPGTPTDFEMRVYSRSYSHIPPLQTTLGENLSPPIFLADNNYESDTVEVTIAEEDWEVFNYETQRNQFCYVNMVAPSGDEDDYRYMIGRILITYVPVENP